MSLFRILTIVLTLCVVVTIVTGKAGKDVDLLHKPLYHNHAYPRDCTEAIERTSFINDGVNLIKPEGCMEPFEVYCNSDLNYTWTVLKKRGDGLIGFNRSWNDYKYGFGFLGTEYWLGLDKIALMTNQKDYQLRIDLFTDSNIMYHMYYNLFRITDEWGNYAIVNIQPHISTPVRLVGGSNEVEGRVEVYHDGQWGTVCNNHWDNNDASVICRQLGYGDAGTVESITRFGEGSGPVWIDDIACSGAESGIDYCGRSRWGSSDCTHEQDAALRCMTIRLVDGQTSNIGRVEVLHDGQWGTICDDSWDDNDASVVCNQLGYSEVGLAISNGAFGSGSGPIWLDEISCNGSETNIKHCISSPWGDHNCVHSEDAGVVCNSVRLAGYSSFPGEGRVEIYYNDQWGTVCDDRWDEYDARVICKQLGFDSGVIAWGAAKFGQGTGPVWLNKVKCNGTESNIFECDSQLLGQNDCSHSHDAGVTCTAVRLVEGTFSHEGRVEIYNSGEWGTICDNDWSDTDASVVCHQLGYGNIGLARNNAAFGKGLDQIWLSDVDCSGSESRLEDCNHAGWGSYNCGHDEDVGVYCGTVRLFGGASPQQGRLEVYHDGQWGTVCDDSWDDFDASVVCRQLGYSDSGTAFGSAQYGEGSGQIWLDELSCDGSESSIANCGHRGWGQHDCGHGEDAGVRCQTVRLIGGGTFHEGRVEIYHDGQWGTVCDDSWDDFDASVVCRQLGYSDSGTAFGNAQYGQGSGQIWLDQLSCVGSESGIDNCGHGGWGQHDCGHGEDAGVKCQKVRLVGGVPVQEGRVEIYHDGQWGTICDNSWDDNDASVICRHLGYGSIGSAFQSAEFGEGFGQIWLDDIDCTGDEDFIENCQSAEWGVNNCDHSRDAGVYCGTIRLTGSERYNEGRVEVYHVGQWGTVCDDGWDDFDASVVCRQLGYSDNGTAVGIVEYGEGSGQIWLDELSCDGSEDTIENCGHGGWGQHNCGHAEDVGVRCQTIRLVGGERSVEGRVEIYHDGQWGTVCDDNWDDNDASVVCRQLGYGSNASAFQSAEFGEGSGPIWLDDINCSGNEDYIENCQSIGWGAHNCGHSEDAGVYCGTIRLVDGVVAQEGRVEIYHEGQWGTVCDNSWDDNDASVICRQLGYGDIGSAFHGAKFGQGSGQIWLNNVDCSGREDNIDSCQSAEWGVHNCTHNEDAGVYCGTTRLIGGVLFQEGRVEIYHDGQWGTICDDGWGDIDASVVCRQLGYRASGTAFGSAHYGEGSGQIWLDDISCDGSEASIENCGNEGWGQHNCDHGEDAGVRCYTVRLIGGATLREGRVEVYHDGQWGTVCDDDWDDFDASVVCVQLGYNEDGTAVLSAQYGEGLGEIWLDGVSCDGSERRIESCRHNGWAQHDCGHGEDAGVKCQIVRLAGGVVAQEGRVEIYHDGQWGTICDNSWDDNDASVMCRQLGYGNIGTAFHGAVFGQGSGQIWLDNVDCTGGEDYIDNCQDGGWGVHNCGHSEDAGVYCGTIRLIGGESLHEGRVEVYHDGQWGTVCDDGWDNLDASVACRQLGYSDNGTAFGGAAYGQGSGQIWLDDISCDGSEGGIEHCGHGGWGQHNCGHGEDAGLKCQSVRLVGGVSPHEGRVELYHDGQWGTVCDDSWDDTDASVICRQLGYGNIGSAFYSAKFGQGSGQIWLDNAGCTGAEDYINNCQNAGWGVHDCSHIEDAGVLCGTLRLIGGTTLQEGRVEVYHDGQWGTVCDNGWDDVDASVVCRRLGYSDSGTAFGSSQYGEGSGQIWLDELSCDGFEESFENCGHRGWGVHNCDHGEDAGVRCNRVRLIGGETLQEGRVEVYHDGQWGTVCDDGWDGFDASVVCRQLEYSDNGTAFGSAQYGEGSGQIWLDDISCDGSEDSIENCGHGGWGQHNCDHEEDAGVRCQTVRLVGREPVQEGRVEIYHEGQWGTICDDLWDDNDASVICRQLGYGNIGSAFHSARFGQRSGPIWLNNVDCSGHETFIQNCQNNDWGDHNCSHTDDAGVLCGTVRLVGGTYPQEGRVEVYHDGQWGTICDDSWDNNDAAVICRQLGYSYNRVSPVGNAYFGKGSGQIWLDDMSCSGSESNIENCGHSDWGVHNCGHSEDAGVRCDTVRLVGGVSTQEGRVEVYYDGQWGTVCDNSWNDTEASVVCRQLGHGTIGSAFHNSIFGQGSDQIWLDNVACSGDETDIGNCQHDAWGDHECGHGEEAGVLCGTLRLAGGDRISEGRIEVYHDNQWGTICDDDWDDTDASVACRQMGYGGTGIALSSAQFGEGSGPIWLDNVRCSGTDLNIENCMNNGWGSHNCGHGEDASIKCTVV